MVIPQAGETRPSGPDGGGTRASGGATAGRDAPPAAPWQVLLVEDNPGDADLVRAALEEAAGTSQVHHVERLSQALSWLQSGHVDAVLLDLSLPDSAGVEGVERLRVACPDLPVVVLTGLRQSASEALRAGAQDYLGKGELDGRTLDRALGHAIERQRYLVQARELAMERAARRAAEVGAEVLQRANDQLKAAVQQAQRAQELETAARTEAELRRQELEAFFTSMVDAVVVYGEERRVHLANRAAAELFGADIRGFTPEEFIERAGLHAPDGSKLPVERLPGVRALGGEIVSGEKLHVRSPTRDHIVLVSAAPVRRSGAARGAVCVHRDVTEQARAEEALREANRNKEEFLAVLSHELRNPLAPIRNSLFILDRAAPGGEQARRAKAVIDRQVHHLTRLVDDLLDVTRISRGKVRLQREEVDLNELVHRCAEDQRSVFVTNGVALEAMAPEELLHVYGDPTRIAQMVGNMLHNASKFTPRGGRVTLSVRRADERFAAIHVCDTGEGIAPGTAAHLFEPFVQGDKTLDRGRGGLGLGLALVKGLAELHDGAVTAHSEGSGKGAEFVLTLPIERRAVPRPGAAAARSEAESVRRVLVIDDNVDAAESLKEALELNGHVVEIANTGPDGVEISRNFLPQVVLCDIGLPGMDGFEVVRTMRSDPELGSIRVIALSGYASAEDLDRSRQAGFDGHLAKPVKLEDLERALSQATASDPVQRL
ncbi:MAG: hypothetical protein A2V77_07655 [Anaeromyxobacter sp. RBG_16_69_14]|nr:MAG: hypothetical protein A2V77_07655 [Anaeromyxobacter sp. RBG_16_69_14]